MIIFACKNCKYTDLSEHESDYICPRRGGLMTSLGVDSGAWNKMSPEEMRSRIDEVYASSSTEAVNTDDGSVSVGKSTESPDISGYVNSTRQLYREPERTGETTHIDKPIRSVKKTQVRPGFIITAAVAFLALASFFIWNNVRGLYKRPATNAAESDNRILETPNPVTEVEEESDYDLSDCLYYSTMTDEERVIYTALYDLVMHKDEPGYVRKVTMEEYDFAKIEDDFKFIYMAMLEDHPEFFYLQSDSVRHPEVEEYSSNFTTHINMSLTPGHDNENEMIAKFERAADDFMKDIDLNASEAEIELQIHDKLIDYVSYDRDILSKMIVEDLAHTAYGALVEDSRGLRRKAVCDGYAYAFQYSRPAV